MKTPEEKALEKRQIAAARDYLECQRRIAVLDAKKSTAAEVLNLSIPPNEARAIGRYLVRRAVVAAHTVKEFNVPESVRLTVNLR